MTNPTRQEIIRAHEALERLERAAWKGSENEYEEMYHSEAKDIILKVLPPKPRPTMAEIDWDDEKHYMAEAEVGEIKLIMLRPDITGWIRCFDPESGKVMPSIEPEDVTPTGRRYALTEIQE